ncbi:MAG TPA: tail fiber protein [Mucilaginibacter sp.]
MEGTMSEIRLFAGTFAPRTWAFCQGQTLAIQSNQALFALIGTTYGGNGVTTFMLPDLRGRTIVSTGQGPGLSSYVLGEVLGVNTVTLNIPTMASHPHTTVITQSSTKGTGSAKLNGINDAGGQTQPGGNYLGTDTTGGAKPYSHPTGTPVPMVGNAITYNSLTVPSPTVSGISNTGNTQPHNNIMPSIAMNYIICLQGIFPSRN